MERADERGALAHRLLGPRRRIDQLAAAMRADVVERLVGIRPGAHDDDRIVEDVVGQIAADLRQILDTADLQPALAPELVALGTQVGFRPEEHTSELQSLMRSSYAVFCLKTKIHT